MIRPARGRTPGGWGGGSCCRSRLSPSRGPTWILHHPSRPRPCGIRTPHRRVLWYEVRDRQTNHYAFIGPWSRRRTAVATLKGHEITPGATSMQDARAGRQTRDREARPAPVRRTAMRRGREGPSEEAIMSLGSNSRWTKVFGDLLRRRRPSQRGRAVGRATEATVAAAPVHRGHGAAPAPLVRRDQQRGRRIQRHPAIPARRCPGGGRPADDHVRQLAGRADDRPDERRHRYGVRPDGAGGRTTA